MNCFYWVLSNTHKSSAIFFLTFIFYGYKMRLDGRVQFPRKGSLSSFPLSLSPLPPPSEYLVVYRNILDATSEELFTSLHWEETGNSGLLLTHTEQETSSQKASFVPKRQWPNLQWPNPCFKSPVSLMFFWIVSLLGASSRRHWQLWMSPRVDSSHGVK